VQTLNYGVELSQFYRLHNSAKARTVPPMVLDADVENSHAR